jgi:hypothetical protein
MGDITHSRVTRGFSGSDEPTKAPAAGDHHQQARWRSSVPGHPIAAKD